MDKLPMPKDFWNYPYNPITGWKVQNNSANKLKMKYRELLRNERNKKLSNKN